MAYASALSGCALWDLDAIEALVSDGASSDSSRAGDGGDLSARCVSASVRENLGLPARGSRTGLGMRIRNSVEGSASPRLDVFAEPISLARSSASRSSSDSDETCADVRRNIFYAPPGSDQRPAFGQVLDSESLADCGSSRDVSARQPVRLRASTSVLKRHLQSVAKSATRAAPSSCSPVEPKTISHEKVFRSFTAAATNEDDAGFSAVSALRSATTNEARNRLLQAAAEKRSKCEVAGVVVDGAAEEDTSLLRGTCVGSFAEASVNAENPRLRTEGVPLKQRLLQRSANKQQDRAFRNALTQRITKAENRNQCERLPGVRKKKEYQAEERDPNRSSQPIPSFPMCVPTVVAQMVPAPDSNLSGGHCQSRFAAESECVWHSACTPERLASEKINDGSMRDLGGGGKDVGDSALTHGSVSRRDDLSRHDFEVGSSDLGRSMLACGAPSACGHGRDPNAASLAAPKEDGTSFGGDAERWEHVANASETSQKPETSQQSVVQEPWWERQWRRNQGNQNVAEPAPPVKDHIRSNGYGSISNNIGFDQLHMQVATLDISMQDRLAALGF